MHFSVLQAELSTLYEYLIQSSQQLSGFDDFASPIAQMRISALHRVTVQPVPFGAQAPDSNAVLRALCVAAPGVTKRELS